VFNRLKTTGQMIMRLVTESGGGNSVASKAAIGMRWMTASRVILEGARFLRLFILARLLNASDFGLSGVAWFVLATVEMFSELGFSAALVRTTNDVNEYVDTVFWAQLTRCLLQGAAVYAIAPALCGWMHAPNAVLLVRVSAAWLVLRGFNSPGQILAARDLRFEKIFAINVSEAVIGVISSAVFGFWLRSAWAVIAAMLTAQLAATVSSYWVAPFRPRFRFSRQRFKELSAFGRWVTASNAVIFLSMEADKFLVSRYFGPASLGFYFIAAKIASIPRVISSELVARVALSMFAKMQNDPEKLRRTYQTVETGMICVAGGVALTVAVFAYPTVHFILGAKWAPVVGFLFILPFSEAVHSVTIVGGELFYACNRPYFRLYLNLLRFATLLTAAWVLTPLFGILGIAVSALASNLIVVPFYNRCVLTATRPRCCDVLGASAAAAGE
jgi:lipopolysaccharide exporter